MIKNKRKQKKAIEKLELLRNMYDKLCSSTYKEEYEKMRKRKTDIENIENIEDIWDYSIYVLHSSEDCETFEEKRSKKIEGVLKLYNSLNEKLPEHMRLGLLE